MELVWAILTRYAFAAKSIGWAWLSSAQTCSTFWTGLIKVCRLNWKTGRPWSKIHACTKFTPKSEEFWQNMDIQSSWWLIIGYVILMVLNISQSFLCKFMYRFSCKFICVELIRNIWIHLIWIMSSQHTIFRIVFKPWLKINASLNQRVFFVSLAYDTEACGCAE